MSKARAAVAQVVLALAVTGLTALPARAGFNPPDLDLVDIAPAAAAFSLPTAVRFTASRPGDAFVLEKRGVITIVRNGARVAPAFLDIDALIAGGTTFSDERGLLGLAFHPNYASNRFIYVSYTDANSDTRIVRYTVSAGNPDDVDEATATDILRVDQDYQNHNGGDIAFGPDNFLYIGLGDGGSGGDPCERGQTLRPAQLPANDGNDGGCPADAAFTTSGGNANSRALLGKMLRIDVDATTPAGANELCAASPTTGAANYAIPPTNPYAGAAGTAGNCDEIWSYGLRNPYRFSFDRTTGDLFIADVGQRRIEEIDFQPAASIGGENWGWDVCEGTELYNEGNPDVPLGNCNFGVLPILQYSHSTGGCSVTGGYRYRGALTPLVGTYIYADYCTGEIYFGTFNGAWGAQVWRDATFNISSFGEDATGEVYVVDYANGRILRFSSAGFDAVFADGFEDP